MTQVSNSGLGRFEAIEERYLNPLSHWKFVGAQLAAVGRTVVAAPLEIVYLASTALGALSLSMSCFGRKTLRRFTNESAHNVYLNYSRICRAVVEALPVVGAKTVSTIDSLTANVKTLEKRIVEASVVNVEELQRQAADLKSELEVLKKKLQNSEEIAASKQSKLETLESDFAKVNADQAEALRKLLEDSGKPVSDKTNVAIPEAPLNVVG